MYYFPKENTLFDGPISTKLTSFIAQACKVWCVAFLENHSNKSPETDENVHCLPSKSPLSISTNLTSLIAQAYKVQSVKFEENHSNRWRDTEENILFPLRNVWFIFTDIYHLHCSWPRHVKCDFKVSGKSLEQKPKYRSTCTFLVKSFTVHWSLPHVHHL